MATRVRPSRHGMMLCTTPSAGEITRPVAISRSGSRKNHSIAAVRAVAGTAAAAQRPDLRDLARHSAAVAAVGSSHGDEPRARVTRPRRGERPALRAHALSPPFPGGARWAGEFQAAPSAGAEDDVEGWLWGMEDLRSGGCRKKNRGRRLSTMVSGLPPNWASQSVSPWLE
ncbi:hypothetical protein GCM10027168_22530 [Streptomyces capparidis]